MPRSIDRLIRLARKTGDRLIIHDPSDERDIVIMDLDQYEILVDAKSDLEEYIEDFQQYRETYSPPQEVKQAPSPYMPVSHQIPVDIPVHDEPLIIEEEETPPVPLEEEFVPQPKDDADTSHDESVFDAPIAVPPTRVANWTPASSLLEEKFRTLTGQGTGTSSPATGDQEPRRIPMREMPDSEEEFDEDDDEPVFLEEPV